VQHRLNPLTLLTAAAAVLVITTAASHWAVSLVVMLGALLTAGRAGVAGRLAPAAAVILLPLWLSLLVMHGLFFPEGRTVLAQWGPARVTVEGLTFAADMGLRTAAFVLVLLLFSFTVHLPSLVAVMTERRVPPHISYVLASTLSLAPVISSQLARIRQAQEARGLVFGGGLGQRMAAARLQMVPLVLGLIQDAATRAQALEARGFARRGARSSYREVEDSEAQRRFRLAALVLAAAAVVLRLAASSPLALPGLWPPA
jgi:energy-coupling factor transport system permease protein